MKRVFIAMVLVLCCWPLPGPAEHGCQPGYTPVFQGNQRVCTVDYNLPSWRQQAPAAPVGRWVDRWGAVAFDAPTRITGWSASQRFRRTANKAALKQCREKGGTRCVLLTWFYNTCMSAVWSEQGIHLGSQPGEEEAIQDGIAKCKALGHAPCRPDKVVCSLPVLAYPVRR